VSTVFSWGGILDERVGHKSIHISAPQYERNCHNFTPDGRLSLILLNYCTIRGWPSVFVYNRVCLAGVLTSISLIMLNICQDGSLFHNRKRYNWQRSCGNFKIRSEVYRALLHWNTHTSVMLLVQAILVSFENNRQKSHFAMQCIYGCASDRRNQHPHLDRGRASQHWTGRGDKEAGTICWRNMSRVAFDFRNMLYTYRITDSKTQSGRTCNPVKHLLVSLRSW